MMNTTPTPLVLTAVLHRLGWRITDSLFGAYAVERIDPATTKDRAFGFVFLLTAGNNIRVPDEVGFFLSVTDSSEPVDLATVTRTNFRRAYLDTFAGMSAEDLLQPIERALLGDTLSSEVIKVPPASDDGLPYERTIFHMQSGDIVCVS